MITVLALGVRSDAWLRTYKYTWAAVGIGLLLLTFLFGSDVNGARLTLSIGPLSGQPSELLKVILVVFLAGYLSENRALLADESTRIGPIRLPPLPYLAPMARDARDRARHRRRPAGPRRRAAVLRRVPRAAVRGDRPAELRDRRACSCSSSGSWVLYNLFGHVQTRVDNWLDPWRDPQGAGFQVIQALYAFGRGGILGVGLGNGLPTIGGRPPVPAIHTDYPLAALGEELGLIGLLAILGLYLVVVLAGAADRRRRRTTTSGRCWRPGLALVIGVQAFIIAAGNLKLIPLTGHHAAADLVRRLVAAGERRRHRAPDRPLGPGHRAAARATRARAASAGSASGGRRS